MPPRLTMHLRTRGQRSDATPTRRKVGGKQRNPRHSNPSLPSLWDGPLRSRAAPQPASTPPPRSAPHGSRSTSHPRRHKAARLPKSRRKPQRAGTHSLECWPALTESGKEDFEHRRFPLFSELPPTTHRPTANQRHTNLHTASKAPSSAAKQAAKAARKRPIQNPSMPSQRDGPRPARTGGAANSTRTAAPTAAHQNAL